MSRGDLKRKTIKPSTSHEHPDNLKFLIKNIPYTLVDRITKKEGAPLDSHYHEAHSVALGEEKAHFPIADYEALERLEKEHPDDWLGDNFPSGKIIISKIVPEKYRQEVAFHEFIERRELDKLDRGNKKKSK